MLLRFSSIIPLFIFSQVYGQTIDSLKNEISQTNDPHRLIELNLHLAEQYQNTQDIFVYVAEARKYYDEATPAEKAKLDSELAIHYGKLSEFDSALFYFEKAAVRAEKADEDLIRLRCYNGLGTCYQLMGDLDQSIDNFLKALTLAENADLIDWNMRILNNLAGSYFYFGDYKNALKHSHQALKMTSEYGDPGSTAAPLIGLTYIHDALDQADSAIYYNKRAMEVLETSRDTSMLVHALDNLAGIYTRQNQYNKAVETYDKLQSIALSFEYFDIYTESLLHLSEIYLTTDDLLKAEGFAIRALEEAEHRNFLLDQQNSHNVLFRIYQKGNNLNKAIHHLKKYQVVKDSILNKETNDRIAELKTQYETEKKQEQIENLNQINQLQQANLEKTSFQRWLWFAISILFLLICVILFLMYRYRSRTNEKLKNINASKDRIFSIIAHDLKNPLAAFNTITQSLSENMGKISEKEMLYFIKKLSQSSVRLNKMLENLLEWSLSEAGNISFNPERFNIKSLVADNVNLFRDSAEVKSIILKNKVPDDLNIVGDYQMIDTVLRNLISNAIKFTPTNGEINITAKGSDNMVQVSVSDTGIGISKEDLDKLFKQGKDVLSIGDSAEKGTGLGLLLCKQLINRHEGEIRAESIPGKGSSFMFSIKKSIQKSAEAA